MRSSRASAGCRRGASRRHRQVPGRRACGHAHPCPRAAVCIRNHPPARRACRTPPLASRRLPPGLRAPAPVKCEATKAVTGPVKCKRRRPAFFRRRAELSILTILVRHEAPLEAGLPHTGISNDDVFEDIVVLFAARALSPAGTRARNRRKAGGFGRPILLRQQSVVAGSAHPAVAAPPVISSYMVLARRRVAAARAAAYCLQHGRIVGLCAPADAIFLARCK